MAHFQHEKAENAVCCGLWLLISLGLDCPCVHAVCISPLHYGLHSGQEACRSITVRITVDWVMITSGQLCFLGGTQHTCHEGRTWACAVVQPGMFVGQTYMGTVVSFGCKLLVAELWWTCFCATETSVRFFALVCCFALYCAERICSV